MSASSSRIMIAPVDDSRPLSDRFIDRLLGWWDVGGGRTLRRGTRDLIARGAAGVRRVSAPVLEKPLVGKAVQGLGHVRRLIGKAFAHDAPPTPPRRDELRATVSTEAPPAPAPIAPPPVTTRPATAEIRPRTAPSITRPVTASVMTTVTPTRTSTLTTALRCWSCLQRHRVRSPRRGGCFHCPSCRMVMLVVDPVVGLTCDAAQAQARGITRSHEADETGEIVRTPLN